MDEKKVNEEYLDQQLERWFKYKSDRTNIIELIKDKRKYKQAGMRRDRKKLITEALKASKKLQNALGRIEREHPECHNKLEQSVRLRQLLDVGFDQKNDISEMLNLIDMTLNFFESSQQITTESDKIKQKGINYKLICNLERLWNTRVEIPIIETKEGAEEGAEFFICLGLCLYGDIQDSIFPAQQEFKLFKASLKQT